MIGHKKCLLLTHNESLYSIFLYGLTKKSIPTLFDVVCDMLTELMRRDDFTIAQITKMLKSLETLTYTKTSDRSVTGNMTDMTHLLKYLNMS